MIISEECSAKFKTGATPKQTNVPMWLLLFDDGNDAGKADLKAEMVYPDWYERRVVRGERRGRWTVKRDLYDWWLRKIETEIHVGHRFYGIMTLAIYAVKCSIDEGILQRIWAAITNK